MIAPTARPAEVEIFAGQGVIDEGLLHPASGSKHLVAGLMSYLLRLHRVRKATACNEVATISLLGRGMGRVFGSEPPQMTSGAPAKIAKTAKIPHQQHFGTAAASQDRQEWVNAAAGGRPS